MHFALKRPAKERPAIEGGQPVRPADRYLAFGAPRIDEAEIVAALRAGSDWRLQRDWA